MFSTEKNDLYLNPNDFYLMKNLCKLYVPIKPQSSLLNFTF